MNHPLPWPAWQRAPAPAALVAVLHAPGSAELAHELVRAWAPAVPTAAMSTMPVSGAGGADEALEGIADRLGRAGLNVSHLVLAGVGGGEETALQLVFGRAALGCAGVVICGDSLPPLLALGGRPAAGRAKLRLVWAADDLLLCAEALGDLLRRLRVAGLDAQGAVVPRSNRPAPGVDGGPSLPSVRLGGAYLAELAAVALDATNGSDPGKKGG